MTILAEINRLFISSLEDILMWLKSQCKVKGKARFDIG